MRNRAEKELIYTRGALYVFDFDGTLCAGDSMIRFLKAYAGKALFYLRLPVMLWYTLQYLLKLKDKTRWKESFLNLYLKNASREDLERTASRLADCEKKYLYADALEFISRIRQDNDVVVVSASLDIWLNPLMKSYGLDVICTQARYEDGRFKGIGGGNCNGPDKVNFLKRKYDLKAYSSVLSFGNSSGDYALYSISDHYYHKFFGSARRLS